MNRPALSPLSWLALAAAVGLLTGCNDNEVVTAANNLADPQKIVGSYATIFCVVALLLFFFAGKGLWRTLLDTVRYVGLLSFVVAPLYYVMTANMKAAVAMGLSGLLGMVAVTLLFPEKADASRRRRRSEDKKDE